MILGAIGHVLSLKCTMYLVKETTGIGRGHGRSKAAEAIREQKQQIKDLKDRIQALESENKALRESQEPKTKEASKPKTERKAKAPEKVSSNLKPGPELDRTFQNAYDDIRNGREFLRIPDLRQKLNISREVFDEEIRRLRDNMIISMAQAEQRYYTRDELADCWVDENGDRMGTLFWI